MFRTALFIGNRHGGLIKHNWVLHCASTIPWYWWKARCWLLFHTLAMGSNQETVKPTSTAAGDWGWFSCVVLGERPNSYTFTLLAWAQEPIGDCEAASKGDWGDHWFSCILPCMQSWSECSICVLTIWSEYILLWTYISWFCIQALSMWEPRDQLSCDPPVIRDPCDLHFITSHVYSQNWLLCHTARTCAPKALRNYIDPGCQSRKLK